MGIYHGRAPPPSPSCFCFCSPRLIALRTTPILLLRPVPAPTENRARAHPDSHRREEKAALPNPPKPPDPSRPNSESPPPNTLSASPCSPPRSSARLRSTPSAPPRSGSSGSAPSLVRCALLDDTVPNLREFRTALTRAPNSLGRPHPPPPPGLAHRRAPPGLHVVARLVQLVPRPRPAVWAAPQDHQVEQRRRRRSGRIRPRPRRAPQGLLL